MAELCQDVHHDVHVIMVRRYSIAEARQTRLRALTMEFRHPEITPEFAHSEDQLPIHWTDTHISRVRDMK